MYEAEMSKLRELYRQGVLEKTYYKNSLEGIGSFLSYDRFCRIPFMTKQSIRETPIMERTNTAFGDIHGVFSSSGTTGDKTFYVYNRNDQRVHEEFVRTYFTQLGITPCDIGGVMAPIGTGVMAHTMMWQFQIMGAGYINCPDPSPESILEFTEKVPITVISTRPSIVSSVAYSPEWTIRAQRSSVRTLALGGGFLSAQRRQLLERVWDAKCYSLLGMSEMFGPIASECPAQDGMHYLDRYLLIEVVDPVTKQPVPDGKPGVAVYTTLWDKGFPLLRYWTDDVIRIEREQCVCGCGLPRIYYVGRRADCYEIGDRTVYPEQVEDILFSYGLIGDYRIDKTELGYNLYSESMIDSLPAQMMSSLEELLQGSVTFYPLERGALNYHGVGRRFRDLCNK